METWKPVPVDFFADAYEISSLGRLRKLAYIDTNGRRHLETIIKPGRDWTGDYPSYTLRWNGRSLKKRAHSLVALAFLGPRPVGMEVCHNNSNPNDCRVDNLRYDTRAGNFADKKIAGTGNSGSQHANSKVTEDQVIQIRQKRAEGATLDQLCSEFGLSKGTISMIYNRKRWSHV